MNRLQLLDRILSQVIQAARTMAVVSAVAIIPVMSAAAQKKGERVKVLAGSALRTAPGGPVVGVLSRTFEAPVEMVEGSAVRLKISGFVVDKEVRAEPKSQRGIVGASGGKAATGGTLRVGPGEKDAELASLNRGAVVFLGQKSAAYHAVNRTVWVDKSRLLKFSAGGTVAKTPPQPAPAKPPAKMDSRPARSDSRPAPASAVSADQTKPPAPAPSRAANGVSAAAPALPLMQMGGTSALRSGPDGNILTSLPAGTLVTPLGAENGWTRVRVEGWVATQDLAEATQKALGELSAADLRADPVGTKGRTVRWTVEKLSYQLADGLRRELNGEPYLLARGPGKERSLLYLAVPDSLVTAAQALAPLSTITVTARVRSGRSQPGGVPILDLLELTRR